MSKQKETPQNLEEMVKTAQEAAVKEAIEQAQAIYGSIPGLQMPDMGNMQEQIMAQMKTDVSNIDEIQAQQAAIMKAAGIDIETIASQSMEYAHQVAQDLNNMNEFDEEWTINRSNEGKLNKEQLRLLAFGAPLLVYNDEKIDTIDCESDSDTIKYILKEWWDVTDHKSTAEIVKWLLEEGVHAEADNVLADIHKRGVENIPAEERYDEENKMGDACLIVESILKNGWCPVGKLPQSTVAWDLVRAVNLGRWAYLCDYINEDEMWQVMQITADTAQKYFSSWEEYGRSFVIGRGIWHGEPQDCESAHEIVTLLLENEESPWKLVNWEK
ncbi:DUF1266 domain-containing protein [Coprobacter tertius]|uniref:DUF1266 domain-containing protein n=1 Tax=Coprobacter tertius TaxID=2944915 RepID=A0ABT1MK62_9BACT|nr:DUF1266 domain-containing protein [Coprobacter tertius]MCP9612251.1 DUF1266 domain-containing protein [Coprobacter tertius]